MRKLISLIKLIDRIVKGRMSAEYLQFAVAKRVSSLIYPKYKFSDYGRLFLDDHGYKNYYDAHVAKHNYHSYDRKYTLDQLMKIVALIDGDTVECGAYEGASSFLMCRRIEGSGRRHHVFDSFEGLSAPRAEDGGHWAEGDLSCGEEAVREKLREFACVVYHKGWIPSQFGEVSDCRFAFVHIDVDLYQPTLESLSFFYDRLTRGGVILCDDYGFVTCPGAKLAMDDFFKDKPEEIVGLSTGQGLVIKG